MSRSIICADALQWLPEHGGKGAIITSLPDMEELDITSIHEYAGWLTRAVTACLYACAPGAPAIFHQTDRKIDGYLFSKAASIFGTAEVNERRVLWHKIVLRRGVGKLDLFRPGFTHLIAVGDLKCRSGKATPDVIERGEVAYRNGFSMNAARISLDLCKGSTDTIVDPFCGKGTIPAMAEAAGFHAIGVDIDPQQCEEAKAFTL